MPLDYLPIMDRRNANPRKLVQPSRLAWHPAVRSPASSRVALLTSAAIRRAGQPNYMLPDDVSYRIVPADPAVTDLKLDHRSPVGADACLDPEIVFPRNALTFLANQGLIGSVASQPFFIRWWYPPPPRVGGGACPGSGTGVSTGRCRPGGAGPLLTILPRDRRSPRTSH